MTKLILFGFNRNMDNISFQSRIRITNSDEFRSLMNREFKQVNYPWSIKETVRSAKVRTDGILDCTALGVTNGRTALLFHICPTNPKNSRFKRVANLISERIMNLGNPEYLQGFILGSKAYNTNSPRSTELFEIMEKILISLHIPYSKFKGGNYGQDIAYNTTKDEWIIGSNFLDVISSPKRDLFESPQKAVNKIFDQVKIADCDELTW